jgi:hypothetical protein
MATTLVPDAAAARRWCVAVLGPTLGALLAVAAFNAFVDPFQQYHLAARYGPRFYQLHHRYINPGLAKNAQYDTIVTGSSIMENTRASDVNALCGGAAVNLTMPAQSARELRLMVGTALASRRVRRAIVVLDFNAFAGAPDERQAVAGPLPAHLYDHNPFNDLPYLLSFDVLRKSWRIVRDEPDGTFTTDPDAPWYWGEGRAFDREKVLQGLDLANLNARFQQPARTLAGMQTSFDQNLLPLIAAHPDTEFDLVWPPYSILVFLDFAQRDQLDVSLAFKRHVFEATRSHRNARIFDLQSDAAITHDLDRYLDIYHFAPDVNRSIVRAACGREREHEVAAHSIDAFERRLREQVHEAGSPDGLARITGRARAH